MHIIDEHYHVYNRGAHKAEIFLDKSDYERFIKLLYVANDDKRLLPGWSKELIWFEYPKNRLVDIFSYCLMPNHFHLGIVEKSADGIEKFMRRLCTAYAMYYNKKYYHSGTIFQGCCKSKHVDKDSYLQYLIEYIHLNPFGIEEPELTKWAKLELRDQAIEYSKNYDFSSFKDYLGIKRPQNILLTFVEVAPPTEVQ